MVKIKKEEEDKKGFPNFCQRFFQTRNLDFLPQSHRCKSILRFFVYRYINPSPQRVPAKDSHVRSQSCVGGLSDCMFGSEAALWKCVIFI